jgi:ABC-type polysaccharide/polyol phosphate export permease
MLEIYRDALFYGKFPELNILIPFFVFSFVMLALGILFFRKTKRGFGELL